MSTEREIKEALERKYGPLLDQTDVADALKVTKRTVRRLELKRCNGRRPRYSAGEVARFVARRR